VAKGFIIVLILIFILSAIGTALAFPLEFGGDLSLQRRGYDDTVGGSVLDKENLSLLRVRFNVSGKIDDNTSFFSRFSEFSNSGGQPIANGNGRIDQYGLKLKSGDWNFSVGRQTVTLGQGSIISTGDNTTGPTDQFYGVIASTKAGNVSFNFISGKTDTTAGSPIPAQMYGFDALAKLSGILSAGVAYGVNKDQPNAPTLKNWAINTTINAVPNLTINVEYVKSNAGSNNRGYLLAAAYTRNKDSITIQYNNVQGNAIDPVYGGIGAVGYPFKGAGMGPVVADNLRTTPNYKGFSYTYDHQLNKVLDFNVTYLDLKVEGQPGSDKEIAAGWVWKF
jgi:hypothetical protein